MSTSKYPFSIHLSSNTALAILRGLFAFIFRHFLNLLKGWLGGLGWGWSGDEVDKIQRSWQLIISRQTQFTNIQVILKWRDRRGSPTEYSPISRWVSDQTNIHAAHLGTISPDLVTIMSWADGHQSTDSNERPIQSLLF